MEVTEELKDILLKINQLQAEIEQLRPISPELEQRIMQKFRLDWNYHSNHIEGNQLTYGETKTFILHGLTAKGKPFKDHLDIKGHNDAILWLEEVIKQNRPLNETFICQLHEMILVEPYQVDAITPKGLPTKRWISLGKYKTTPNHVRTKTGEMFYFASPEETPAKMNDLMEWYRQMIDNQGIPHILTAALLHYKFIRIHPFDDGNGRMARILMNLILMIKGYAPVIIKSEKKEQYYQALQMADGGDELAFVAYIGEQLIHSQEIYLKGAKGESIEEMDDIDKEIALLKKRLEGEKEKIQLNNKVKISAHQNVIRPLIEKIFTKMEQFDDFFINKEINLITGTNREKVRKSSEFFQNLDNFIKQNELFHLVGLSISWLEFKKTQVLNGWGHIEIHFMFNIYNSFQIVLPKSEFSPITISYDNLTLSDPTHNEIANALAKDVLNQIKKQLKNEENGN